MSGAPTWDALPVRPIAQPTVAARAAAVERMVAWARERSARFDALTLGVDEAGNSTVRAARALADGEAIVRIPRSLIISDDNLAATATGEPDPFGGACRDPRETMAVWLALEVERADSPWRPFLDTLPVAFPDVPVFRDAHDLALLAGTAAQIWAADIHEETVQMYASFDAPMRARLSLAAYAWGRAVVRTRGFSPPSTQEHQIAFIPIVDLMDHRRDETGWEYVVETGEYALYALRDFAAGEPVHFTYGEFGNAHLFVQYGFALPDNPFDEAVLFFGGAPVLVRAQWNEQLAHALSLASPSELGAEARRRLAEIDHSDAGPNASDWETTCALVRRGERTTLEWIIEYARRVVAGAPASRAMSAEPTWDALPVRANNRPSPAARAAAIARLEAWAVARGARFDALELGVDAAGDSTVRARRALVAAEAIVTIPRDLILSDDDLAATATGDPDPYGGAQRNPRDTMAAWLALEVERADSPWRPLLDVLPVAFPDVPVFRGGDELEPLAGTAARVWAAETHADIVASHAAFVAPVRARVSLAAYAWGRSVVRSRGFNAPFTLDPRIAFIPIIDLMDHARDETTWEYVPRRGEYVLRTLRDFAAGEPVHFTYGTYGNAHLLVEYGFALPDNPYDEAVLFLYGEPVLVRAEPNDQLAHALSLVGPAELGEEARRRLASIDDRDAGSSAGTWETTCALVRRGERRTLEWLVAHAERLCDIARSGS